MRLLLSGSLPVLVFASIFLIVLIAPVMGAMGPAMFNTDLFGPNMASKDVVPGNDGKTECLSWCENTPGCVGATWVAPGVQGTSARCWIKNEVSQIIPNKDCCISWTTQTAVQPSRYPVDITSNPQGREFVVDSKIGGTTPVTITLELGNHQILFPRTVRVGGSCPEYTETLFVSGATKITYDLPSCVVYTQAPHTPISGTGIPRPHYSVDVRSIPTGAQLTVDSKVWGNTPVTITAEKGNHQVLLQKTGYKDYSATIELSSETELVYTLIPSEVTTNPVQTISIQTPHIPTVPTQQPHQTPHTTSGPPASPFIVLVIIFLFAVIRRGRDA